MSHHTSMIIRYMFSLLFWLHYSSKPEESIKIRRRYCHSIQRTYCHNRHGVLHRTLDAPVDKLARNYRILSRTVTAPTPLLLVCSAVAQIPLVPCWPTIPEAVVGDLDIDLRPLWYYSLHSIFWLRVLCRMPFLKHPPHFSPGLGPAQLLLW